MTFWATMSICSVGTPQSVVPHVAAGKLKAYGITAKEKSPQLPTAESLVDALGPKFDIVYWQGCSRRREHPLP